VRPDMVIRSETGNEFIVLIESKVESDFGEHQLEDYQMVLQNTENAGFKQRRLVSLTKYANKLEFPPTRGVHSISWSQVFDLLANAGSEYGALQIIYSQFADFLKEKGMKPMNLPKTNPEKLSRDVEGIFFREVLAEILNELRQHQALKKLKPELRCEKEIKFDENEDETRSLGIYDSKDPHCFYFGFGFGTSEKPKLVMTVSKAFEGRLSASEVVVSPELRGYQKEPVPYAGQTWFNFEQLVESESVYDGDRAEVVRWFARMIPLVQNLRRISKR